MTTDPKFSGRDTLRKVRVHKLSRVGAAWPTVAITVVIVMLEVVLYRALLYREHTPTVLPLPSSRLAARSTCDRQP
jgi:hypothetical protein